LCPNKYSKAKAKAKVKAKVSFGLTLRDHDPIVFLGRFLLPNLLNVRDKTACCLLKLIRKTLLQTLMKQIINTIYRFVKFSSVGIFI
jgi:hypothetical protein